MILKLEKKMEKKLFGEELVLFKGIIKLRMKETLKK